MHRRAVVTSDDEQLVQPTSTHNRRLGKRKIQHEEDASDQEPTCEQTCEPARRTKQASLPFLGGSDAGASEEMNFLQFERLRNRSRSATLKEMFQATLERSERLVRYHIMTSSSFHMSEDGKADREDSASDDRDEVSDEDAGGSDASQASPRSVDSDHGSVSDSGDGFIVEDGDEPAEASILRGAAHLTKDDIVDVLQKYLCEEFKLYNKALACTNSLLYESSRSEQSYMTHMELMPLPSLERRVQECIWSMYIIEKYNHHAHQAAKQWQPGVYQALCAATSMRLVKSTHAESDVMSREELDEVDDSNGTSRCLLCRRVERRCPYSLDLGGPSYAPSCYSSSLRRVPVDVLLEHHFGHFIGEYMSAIRNRSMADMGRVQCGMTCLRGALTVFRLKNDLLCWIYNCHHLLASRLRERRTVQPNVYYAGPKADSATLSSELNQLILQPLDVSHSTAALPDLMLDKNYWRVFDTQRNLSKPTTRELRTLFESLLTERRCRVRNHPPQRPRAVADGETHMQHMQGHSPSEDRGSQPEFADMEPHQLNPASPVHRHQPQDGPDDAADSPADSLANATNAIDNLPVDVCMNLSKLLAFLHSNRGLELSQPEVHHVRVLITTALPLCGPSSDTSVPIDNSLLSDMIEWLAQLTMLEESNTALSADKVPRLRNVLYRIASRYTPRLWHSLHMWTPPRPPPP